MKLATANYPAERLPDWPAYAAKAEAWVSEARASGADLLVFPEYAGLEAALALNAGERDAAAWCRASAEAVPQFLDLWRGLARAHDVHILCGSLPTEGGPGLVNRAHLIAPDGTTGYQDKQILTPWERAATPLVRGEPLTVFETTLGQIGILICYDGEFPLQGRALGCDLLLVPSCTEAMTGLARVQIGARARALEGQCYTALSCLTGDVPGCDPIEENRGRAGVFAPPDRGFPADGIVALGAPDAPGWVLAEVDLKGLSFRRQDSEVTVPGHWHEQSTALGRVATRMTA